MRLGMPAQACWSRLLPPKNASTEDEASIDAAIDTPLVHVLSRGKPLSSFGRAPRGGQESMRAAGSMC
ncbi:hypothetical protein DUNSADRAFT_5088 [Dunaliella salina]|uniref:Encoded protein n=1 Tax=Dunaliella salina TaxID=3046 RepID=A0ABQ7HAG9_DUNSA|nr:hypothetical protein DUNSADRAFT_5088 [Dunaliella salina]|eukprot:KAF5843850.1 hypothetical protein DUNSADRAFT_5088 [Dunaliella salina]